eukprot:768514-Hanusia_phi.AAC.2
MDMAREKQHKRCVVMLDLARTQGKVDMEQVQMVEKAAEFIASGLIQKVPTLCCPHGLIQWQVRKDSLVQNQLKNLSSYPSMVTWASLRTRKVPSSTTSTSKTAKKAGLKGSSKTKKGLSLKHKTQSIGQVGLKSWTLNKLDTNPRSATALPLVKYIMSSDQRWQAQASCFHCVRCRQCDGGVSCDASAAVRTNF